MKTKMMTMVFLAGMMILPLWGQGGPDARTVMQKSISVAKVPGMEAVTELRITDARGRERIRKIAMASRDEGTVEKRIIRFLEPADVKGTALLVFDYPDKKDEMWLYMPAIRKIRKIVSTEKGKNFMGSEFSNADMAAPNLGDFHFRTLGEEEAGGIPCYKIEMVPLNDRLVREYGFAKKILWIGKKDYVMRKAVYYDEEGEKVKVLTAKDVKAIDPAHEKFLAMEMTMVNEQNGRKSYFRMLQVQYNPNVKKEYFTLGYLERR